MYYKSLDDIAELEDEAAKAILTAELEGGFSSGVNYIGSRLEFMVSDDKNVIIHVRLDALIFACSSPTQRIQTSNSLRALSSLTTKERLRVPELQVLCYRAGADPTGRKAELVEQLELLDQTDTHVFDWDAVERGLLNFTPEEREQRRNDGYAARAANTEMTNAARTAKGEQTSFEKRDATKLAQGAAGQITRILKNTTRHIVLTAVLRAGAQGLTSLIALAKKLKPRNWSQVLSRCYQFITETSKGSGTWVIKATLFDDMRKHLIDDSLRSRRLQHRGKKKPTPIGMGVGVAMGMGMGMGKVEGSKGKGRKGKGKTKRQGSSHKPIAVRVG